MRENKMRVLDLFSGIGGFSLGLERAGMETVAFCEIDEFCHKVLKKHWPSTPIFTDVSKLKWNLSVQFVIIQMSQDKTFKNISINKKNVAITPKLLKYR